MGYTWYSGFCEISCNTGDTCTVNWLEKNVPIHRENNKTARGDGVVTYNEEGNTIVFLYRLEHIETDLIVTMRAWHQNLTKLGAIGEKEGRPAIVWNPSHDESAAQSGGMVDVAFMNRDHVVEVHEWRVADIPPEDNGIYSKLGLVEKNFVNLTLNITANGSDGPVTVSMIDPVSIDIRVNPGGRVGKSRGMVDCGALGGFGVNHFVYSYVYPIGWKEGTMRCVEMPLQTVTATSVFNGTLLPAEYEFFFVLDDIVNNRMDVRWVDSVRVTVE